MPDERGTAELMVTLRADCDKCLQNIAQSIDDGVIDDEGTTECADDYEFHARQLIRTLFAYIEGVTFSLKVYAAKKCIDSEIEISSRERHIACEVAYNLNDKGEIVERPARINLTSNIRFAFSLYERAHNLSPQMDVSSEWWSCLKKSIKVRDRLMHPRMPEDLDISDDEIKDAIKAMEGFTKIIYRYFGSN